MTCRRKNEKRIVRTVSGFTLVELLAVIAIIGLLASLALPAISRIRERSRIGAAKAQLAHIETALAQFYADNGTFPPMGNDWVDGKFYPSEDVGRDGIRAFVWVSGAPPNDIWVPNDETQEHPYTGPDRDGTEGNYQLDPGEDIGIMPWLGDADPTKGNGKLDGTYYDRLGMFGKEDIAALSDIFGSKNQQYHYYAAYVKGQTDLGMPDFDRYDDLADYQANSPTYYNRWVIYSLGPDGSDHALHNYFLAMQDGEDVGADGYASDPMDDDGDHILFEPSNGENDSIDTVRVPGQIIETRWQTPSNDASAKESAAPGGNIGRLDGPTGNPVFSYDVRQERRREHKVYAMPDGDAAAYGVIMRYGP